MPTNMKPWDAAPAPSPRKTSSTAAKLLQAAALAAVLVPLGSVALEAGPITCGFSGYASDANNGGEGCSFSNGDRNRFNFGDYYFDLTFQGLDPDASFDMTITDNAMTAGDFATRSAGLGSYECAELTATGGCIDFFVEFSPEYPDPIQWDSYTFEIHWEKFESVSPQVFTESTLRVLHDIGGTATNAYDEDMCLAYENCTVDLDPGIRSGDTAFRSFTAAIAAPEAVPEPSSLLLLGTGLSALVYRRRRRTKA